MSSDPADDDAPSSGGSGSATSAPASSAATGAAAGAGGAASDRLRPSGRSSVKSRFVGVTSSNVRRGLPMPAPNTQLVQQLQIAPRRAYMAAAPVPQELIAVAAANAAAHAAATQQKKKQGRTRPAAAASTASDASGPLQAPSASVSTTPASALTSRATPIAGRRAGQPQASPSGAVTARVAVATPRVRPAVQRITVQTGAAEEEKSAHSAAGQPLPEWLQPRAYAAYPAPQAPQSPQAGMPWTAPQLPASAAPPASASSRHPHDVALPATHSFNFYVPASPARGERRPAVVSEKDKFRHYMYSNKQGRSRSGSPQRPAHALASAAAASVDPSQPAAEVWSSFPFVNPRLVREQKDATPAGATEEKESSAGAGGASKSSTPAGGPPSLPGVPRLFGSVVSEQDRSSVFEYLRSTHSRLFAWPPPATQPVADAPADGDAAAPPPADAAPTLPLVPFTDAQLERVIQEGRTALGAIDLLRRLDAELALATQMGLVGQEPRGLPDAPPELVALQRARPPPQPLNSADELILAVEATRVYLAALRRGLLRWCCGGLALFAPPASTDGSAPPPPQRTVFVTQQMVDALINDAIRGGLDEEEVWVLLARWNNKAVEAAASSASSEAKASVRTFATFDELAAAVWTHMDEQRARMLPPTAAPVDAASYAPPASTSVDPPAAQFAALPSFASTSSLLLSSDPSMAILPAAAPPSPVAARHTASSLSYARLLLFKFLRDDSAPPVGDSSGQGGGGGAGLFSQAKDIVASVAQMDALIHSTRGLTLGQQYHTKWRPRSRIAPTAASSAAGVENNTLAGESTAATAAVASRHASRSASPTHDAASSSAPPPAAAPAAVSSHSFNSSTRSYGSFLAARTIRVLRSLLFHGYTNFKSFDDLIRSAEIHTRKLREERVKVYQFLTQPAPAGVERSKKVAAATAGASGVDASPAPELVASLQALTHSNASGSIGLFDVYYIEADRRERTRALEEEHRAAQLKQNTHQFGASLTQQQQQQHSSTASLPSSSAAAAAGGLQARSSPGAIVPDRFRGQKSALFKSVPGSSSSGPNTADKALERQKQRQQLQQQTAPPSRARGHTRAASTMDSNRFDWSQTTSAPPVEVGGGTDPAAIRAAHLAKQQQAALGTGPPLNSATISRYASAKTLPYTPSKSLLLKHADSTVPGTFSPITAGVVASTGAQGESTQLPPLVITPEDVDALFGGMEHLLRDDSEADVPAADAAAPLASSSSLALPPAAAVAPVFDALLEGEDEDFLLSSEPEEPYNSMDLTLLLQQYKSDRGALEQERRDREQPSYLANHPLMKNMLEEAERTLAKQKQQHGQQGRAPVTASTAENGDMVYVVRGATTQQSQPQSPSPASAGSGDARPTPLQDTHMSSVVVQIHPPSARSVEAAQASSQPPAEDDPLNPSSSTAIPTLDSLLNPQPVAPSETTVTPHKPVVETVLLPRQSTAAASSESVSANSATDADGVASPVTPSRTAVSPIVIADAAESHLLSPPSPSNGSGAKEASKRAADEAAPSTPSAAANASSVAPSADETVNPAADTSRDLVVVDPNAVLAPSTAEEPPVRTGFAVDDSRPATAAAAQEESGPLPKMLPVVLQTMQLLRDQGKIKPASAPAPPSASLHGPAGVGSGNTLPQFIPHSGPVIPGGSIGSMKTLAILRELQEARRGFFSVEALVATVCALRAERKWAKRVATQEKRRLIAAGITIARPSGLPNDMSAAVYSGSAASSPRKKNRLLGGAAGGSATASSSSISSVQFHLLSSPHSLASRGVRNIVVDEETEEAEATLESARGGGGTDHSAGMWGSAWQQFLPPSAFPSSLHMQPFLTPASVAAGANEGAGPSSQMRNGGSAADGSEGFSESEARAWARSRLLAHLSGLFLFHDGTASQAGVQVQIRMSELEQLLDALGNGPRDASLLAEKLARKERDALERQASAEPAGSPASESALAALASLPPLSHPLSPLMALLSWLDHAEVGFGSMAELVRSVTTGEWAHTYQQR